MTREHLFDWVSEQYGTIPEYPWQENNAVLRHRAGNKWYGIVQSVRRDRLGFEGSGSVDVVNVKLDPILVGSLRSEPGFRPAYHMNKEKWLSILLDGTADDEQIKELIDMSYALTGARMRKK